MELKVINTDFSVCKVEDMKEVNMKSKFVFIGKTDEELSLVCETCDVPQKTLAREDGWKGFRVEGVLDFSLIGIISKISEVLAENKIGLFVISTFNTDYVLVKKENFEKALKVLENAEYTIVK